MTRIRLVLATLFVAATVSLPAAQDLQSPTPPAIPQVPAVPDVPPPPSAPQDPFDDFDVFSNNRSAVRIGQDFSLGAGNAVRDAVVVLGDATIAGTVDGDLVVILGNVKLASTAAIGGDFVAVGGNVTAEQGTTVRNDLVVVGGSLDAPPGFIAGGEHTIIGGGLLGTWFQDLGPYLARGLLWGRLIVPDLSWVWSIVALFFLLYLAVNVLFDRPVRACAGTLEAKPLTTFGVGLLVLLLVGPICLLLAVSVVGIAVIPFVMFALFAGWIVGKVAVARWIGMSVVPERTARDAMDPDAPALEPTRAQGARSLVIGFLLITIAYMIPLIGIVTWAIVGVLGIGSAFLAFLSAYRKENPRPVAPAAVVPPPSVPPPAPPPLSGDSLGPPPSSSFGSGDAPPAMAFEAVPLPGAGGAAAIPLNTTPPPTVLLTMPKALFRDRLAAFVLDVILLVLAVNILRADPDEMFLPILLLYHIGFWTWKQTTVGGIICQLRIVRIDGAPLTFADALVRGLASIFSLAVFFIGALWILRDPDSQAWHDKIAGTYVVKVPRGWPL
jgi:uncharacterized RDD family membrane protein YckC